MRTKKMPYIEVRRSFPLSVMKSTIRAKRAVSWKPWAFHDKMWLAALCARATPRAVEVEAEVQ